MNTIIQKLRSVELCMSAHPDNEAHSEFADRISDLEEIKTEVTQLLEWKESALKVMNNIDLQKVGKLLGVPLGQDISSQIIPSIEMLIKENEQLKKMVSN